MRSHSVCARALPHANSAGLIASSSIRAYNLEQQDRLTTFNQVEDSRGPLGLCCSLAGPGNGLNGGAEDMFSALLLILVQACLALEQQVCSNPDIIGPGGCSGPQGAQHSRILLHASVDLVDLKTDSYCPYLKP